MKKTAAERWCSAVTAEGSHGAWMYRMAKHPSEVRTLLDAIAREASPA